MSAHSCYDCAAREARQRADASGLDVGIERASEYGRLVYLVRYLPPPEKSFGCDMRAERVHPGEPAWDCEAHPCVR